MPIRRQKNGRNSWKKFSAAYSNSLGNAGEELNNWAKEKLTEACEQWINDYNEEWKPQFVQGLGHLVGDHDHPWSTGNLHDSIAVRIADKNKTVAIRYMPVRATEATDMEAKDGMEVDNIIGHDCAVEEMRKASAVLFPGIQMQLVVGVPYARKVDKDPRHAEYLADMTSRFFSYIEDVCTISIEPMFRTRVFRTKKTKK